MRPTLLALLAASAPAQAIPWTQTPCGPTAPFVVCGATVSPPGTHIWAYGQTGGTVSLALWNPWEAWMTLCGSGPRITVLVGSAQPVNQAVTLPAAFTSTGINIAGVDPVWVMPGQWWGGDQYRVHLPAPNALAGMQLHYQWWLGWSGRLLGSNCITVTF